MSKDNNLNRRLNGEQIKKSSGNKGIIPERSTAKPSTVRPSAKPKK